MAWPPPDEQIDKIRKQASELLTEADNKTIHQMFLFLHGELFMKGHVLAILNEAEPKRLECFIEFFNELNKQVKDD